MNSTKNQRIKSDLLLIVASVIWGSGFIAQSIAAESMGSFTFNFGRFGLGALLILLVSRFRLKIVRSQIRWVILAGFFLFAASAAQQIGLETTSVGNAAFITSLYVVFLPIILWIAGLQKIHAVTWISVGVAAVGALLLSTGGIFDPAPGDWFELAGAFLWAGQILVIGYFGKRSDPLAFSIGEFTAAAGFNLVCMGIFEWGKYSPEPDAWLAVLFSGVFPVAIAFTLQVYGQRKAPPVDAALIFSLEAVFAAIFGYLILGEQLLPVQLLGCGLILAAILIGQLISLRKTDIARPAELDTGGN